MAMKLNQPDLESRLCGVCGASERWLLHYVRHKGTFRKLCTNCVLKNNSGLFCPICLDFFDHLPPQRERVMCVKCPSISHAACVVATSSLHGFQCPPCSQPSFSFFNLTRRQNDSTDIKTTVMIEKKAAKALVAAARIAAVLMAKAAVMARVDAERRVKEALAAKKRAREALERLAFLVAKQEEEEKTAEGVVSGTPESLDVKPKLEGPGQMKPKLEAPDQLKTNHLDAMEED